MFFDRLVLLGCFLELGCCVLIDWGGGIGVFHWNLVFVVTRGKKSAKTVLLGKKKMGSGCGV